MKPKKPILISQTNKISKKTKYNKNNNLNLKIWLKPLKILMNIAKILKITNKLIKNVINILWMKGKNTSFKNLISMNAIMKIVNFRVRYTKHCTVITEENIKLY